MELTLGGKTYTLAANLRVAYNVQHQHNHKPYMEVFQGTDKMPLEEQVGILYEAAKIGTPGEMPSRTEFLNQYLDDPNSNLVNLMALLKAIYEGIVGRELKAAEEEESVGEK